jgi:3-phenylpropionate/cinnamic acid dioxygenase small subunit
LRSRIQRLKETSWLREQAPRLKHLVSNIEIESATDSEVVVSSAFILAELHHHNQYLRAGSTTHKLLPNGEGFKIKYKKVVLLNNNEPLPNLLFLI